MTIELTVSGMSCGGCAASLQKALLAQSAVSQAQVVANNIMSISQ